MTQDFSARRHPAVVVLTVLVFLQCALLIAATVFLVVELVIDTPSSYASALALAVLAAIGAVFLGILAAGILRGQPWVRGGVVTAQILQIAVAVGMFQGFYARPDLGWLLLAPAIVALLLLFSKPVVAATARRE